jgi:hypothetical protein
MSNASPTPNAVSPAPGALVVRAGRAADDPVTVALDVLRASGLGLAKGRVVIPTGQLVAFVRKAAAKAKAVHQIDLVPGDGDVRIHLLLKLMGAETRVVVRAAVAGLQVAGHGGALRLRLVEAPTFSGRYGGKAPGMLGMIGAFGDAALSSLGPTGIAQTVAEFLGAPLSAHGDVLSIDLGAIPAVARALSKPTPLGPVGDLVHVTGARFRAGGLEIGLEVRPRVAVRSLLGKVKRAVLRR